MNFKSPRKVGKAKRLGSPEGFRVTTDQVLRSITSEQELMTHGKRLWVLLGRFLEDNKQPKAKLVKSVSYADILKQQTLALINTLDASRSPQKHRTQKPSNQLKGILKRNSSPKCVHTEASPTQYQRQEPSSPASPTTQAFRFVSYSYDNATAKPRQKLLAVSKPLAVPENPVQSQKQRLEQSLKAINDRIYEQRLRALEKCYQKMSSSNVMSKADQQSLQPNDSRALKDWNINDSQSPGKGWGTNTNPNQNWRPSRDKQTSYNSCFFSKHDGNTPEFSFNADSQCESQPNQNNPTQATNIRKVARNTTNGGARLKHNPMAKKLVRRPSGQNQLPLSPPLNT